MATSPEAPLPPARGRMGPRNCQARSRCAPYASPCKNAVRCAHRTGGQKNSNVRSSTSALHTVVITPTFQPESSLRKDCARARRRLGTGRGGEEGMHRAFSLVASRCRSHPSDLLPGKSGRGGAKMAVPLRIQSDWAQVLR